MAKKLNASLAALASGQPAAAGLRVQNGRVAVELWLNDPSEQVLASLKALGFLPIGTHRRSARFAQAGYESTDCTLLKRCPECCPSFHSGVKFGFEGQSPNSPTSADH